MSAIDYTTSVWPPLRLIAWCSRSRGLMDTAIAPLVFKAQGLDAANPQQPVVTDNATAKGRRTTKATKEIPDSNPP